MSERATRSLAAALVAVVMMATAAIGAVLVVSSGVLGPQPVNAGDRVVQEQVSQPQPAVQTDRSITVNESFQLSQPRDPFKPLITEETPPGGIPGVGGTPGSGGDGGVQPGNTITLERIDVVNGEPVATIVVNGVTYQVQEGDTFAGSFKVIEINVEGEYVLIQYGDIVFQLKVGQSILK